jgi:putative flippase GtrA
LIITLTLSKLNRLARLHAQAYGWLHLQPIRYVFNGLFATAVHFLVLTFNIEALAWSSAGLANLVAAVFGISASFFGSRYYVFRGSPVSLRGQLVRFLILYAAIALLHGALMYVWADLFKLNYQSGFVAATAMQMLCSYLGNKLMVFKV